MQRLLSLDLGHFLSHSVLSYRVLFTLYSFEPLVFLYDLWFRPLVVADSWYSMIICLAPILKKVLMTTVILSVSNACADEAL